MVFNTLKHDNSLAQNTYNSYKRRFLIEACYVNLRSFFALVLEAKRLVIMKALPLPLPDKCKSIPV